MNILDDPSGLVLAFPLALGATFVEPIPVCLKGMAGILLVLQVFIPGCAVIRQREQAYQQADENQRDDGRVGIPTEFSPDGSHIQDCILF